MLKKRLLSLILAAVLLCTACYTVFADGTITVTLNGTGVSFDQPPVIMNDRTMVPMRAVFEAYGADVYWVAETRTIFAAKGQKVLAMTVEEAVLESYDTTGLGTVEAFTGKVSDWISGKTDGNWVSLMEMDAPPVIVNDRTLIPVRAVTEALGAEVRWNPDTLEVIITGDTAPGTPNKDLQFMNDLMNWFKSH